MEENKNADAQDHILMPDHSDDSGDEIVERND